jgi:aryl-alcohol dehydrogenase-like predicted oxidoreductase
MTWGKQNNQKEAFEQMNYALSKGINFFDTAEMYAIPPTPETYGKTETIIGNWLESCGNRKKIILATKFSPLPWARGENNPVINKKNIITAVENSLKRLKTDYIDLYQLHWPTSRPHYHFSNWWDFSPASGLQEKERIIENKIDILQALKRLIDDGKINHIGLSDDSSWGIKQYIELSEKHNLPRIVSIQNEYNLLRRRDEYDVAETCSLEGVSYLPWSPLAMGVLSGKYLNNNFPVNSRFSKEVMGKGWNRYKSRVELNSNKATKEYINIAKKYNLDPCQMAISFTLSKKWVSSSIIGATTMNQLKDNIAAADLKLNQDCLNDIHEIYKQYPVSF